MKKQWPHQRFEEKVERIQKKNGCWLWQGATTGDGHPKMIHGSRTNGTRQAGSAARFAYRFYNGPVEPNQLVHPSCFNRLCVNPHHLKAVTRSELNQRLIKSGRWEGQIQAITERNKTNPTRMVGEDNPSAKLDEFQVRNIRASLENGAQPKNIAKAYAITPAHVSAIKCRRVWKDVP